MKKRSQFTRLLLLSLTLKACAPSEPVTGQTIASMPSDSICIANVIAADDSLGTIRNTASITMPLSEAIERYVVGMQQVNFQDCPDAFKQAFEAHLQAWQHITYITDKYPDYRGELHQLFEKLATEKDSAEFKASLKVIWDTWGDVEKTIPAKE